MEKGQIFILASVVLALVMINTILIISRSFLFNQNTSYSVEELKAINLAEAGIDKAVASFNKNPAYSGESGTDLGPGEFTVSITSKDSSTNIITSTGYIPNENNPKVKRTIRIEMTKGVGTSFFYGLQVGDGGLQMGTDNIIVGSVYSNGNISGGNNNIFTGEVWVAGGTQPSADQESECTDPQCSHLYFGKNIGGNSQYDIAQSFQPSCVDPPTCTPQVINKVSLRLKKVGPNPQNLPNLNVRILSDNTGKPSNNTLAQGTISSNLVTSSYEYVDVALNVNPALTPNTPYWLMVDTCGNSTSACDNAADYWAWSSDLSVGYNRGVARFSPNWQAQNATWNNPSPDVDLDFKVYMGGVATYIDLGNNAIINGDTHANTLNGTFTINGDVFYQTKAAGVTVNGILNPGYPDPAPQTFPISAANIKKWQDDAEAGSDYNGDQNVCNTTLGPGKVINGDLVGNTCTAIIKSPLWVTGNINVGNSVKFKLDPSWGSASGMIIVDGTVTLGNGADLIGTGQPGSFLMLLSNFNSTSNNITAIDTGNSAISGIMYAPTGIIQLPNGASFKEVSTWKIVMGNGGTLTYDTGLSNVVFASGQGGSYSLVKGTYQAK